jgi:hypothetical protein
LIATAIALDTMLTHRCTACGTPHRIRAAVAPDPDGVAPAVVGFFGRCPETGIRVWMVVEVPPHDDGTRVVAFGPPDDDTWEPLDRDELERAWRAAPGRPEAATPLIAFPPRGMRNGGFRDAAGTLRLAFGCPFTP